MTAAAQQVLWEAMSEEEFRQKVLQVAGLGGWRLEYHTNNSKRSPAGFPDEVMIHEGRGLLLVAELKREKDFRISEAQQAWLAGFLKVAELIADYGPERLLVRLWRPSDIDEVERLLLGR